MILAELEERRLDAYSDLDEVWDLLARGEHDKVWRFQEGYRYVPGPKQRD